MQAGNRDEEDRSGYFVPGPPQSPTSRRRYRYEHEHFDDANTLEHLHPQDEGGEEGEAQHLASYARTAESIGLNGADDPVSFYRTYRTSTSTPAELMASTSIPAQSKSQTTRNTGQQRHNPNASLRSNGNGTTPKHPAINGLRPLRSASAPVVDEHAKSRPAAAAAYGSSSSSSSNSNAQPSVKDLKKRFDQNAAAQSSNSNLHQKNSPYPPTRETSYRGVANGQSPYSTLRSSVSRDVTPTTSPSSTRSTQRNRFVPEDQMSNNSQSFASRVSKPRGSAGSAHSLASKSMSNLSPTSPTAVSQTPKPPIPSPGKPLLFGEISPGDSESGIAGHGIEGVRPRRTSESNLRSPTSIHQRSLSHPEAEPASPADWYRGANGVAAASSPTKTRYHTRAHSEQTKPSASSSKPPMRLQPTPDLGPRAAASKLPVRSRNSASSSTSSRSNSPSTLKRPSTRTQPRIPKSASATSSASRVKTPTFNAAGKRPAPAITPNGNTRLNAYISTPPPKLSPPLRSSRPRQPVSTATTASSRMKAIERGRSPAKQDPKSGKNESTRRRKISMGPIDFESRREQIKLSYTKSIRETEAKAAAKRQAAIEREKERRKREAEAQAKAQAEAEAVAEAQAEAVKAKLAIAAAAAAAAAQEERGQGDESKTPDEDTGSPTPVEEAPRGKQRSLTITTSFGEPHVPDLAVEAVNANKDSPDFGIPGSFPNIASPQLTDEAPPSAVSNTTEFDAEPQTEPPQRQDTQPVDALHIGVDMTKAASHIRSEYKSPFEDDSTNEDSESVKMFLDASSGPKEVQPTPTHSEFSVEPDVPGSHKDDDYEPRPYKAPVYETTTVTIISRDSDFSPALREPERVPAQIGGSPVLHDPEVDETQIRAALDHRLSCSQGTQSSEECSSDRDGGLRNLEEFYVGPNVAESAASLRDSTYGPETRNNRTWPIDRPSDAPQFSVETDMAMQRQPSLNVPRASRSRTRMSQNTVWTDFSIDSRGDYPDFQTTLGRADSTYRGHDSESRSVQYDRDTKIYTSSPEVSPHGSYRSPILTSESQHQLPELDTGDGFVVDYMTRKDSTTFTTVPMLPDHSPPPPPDMATFPDLLSSGPPSDYFNDTRPSSYLHGRDDQSSFSMSRPQSENFDQSASTPQSLDQRSLEVAESRSRIDSQTTQADSLDQKDDVTGLPPKEKKRLFTRLETIKELIDTEAFFIRDMNIVEEIYKGTAEACPQLDDKTIKLIFRNTDQIIAFHSAFLSELKQGVVAVYAPKAHRSNGPKEPAAPSDGTASISTVSTTTANQLSDAKDRETSLGPIFTRNMEQMKAVHETFLKNSDHAAKRLIQIQEDATVKVWLNECNEVARDLTKAWNLDSLLIKPMQRITKYPNLLIQLLHETPPDHPDRAALEAAKGALEFAIEEINKTKKNFELVGQIVGRKRKESDVRAGFARAFGKRVDKLQAANNRPPEDAEYLKLHEKFGDDYLRLQVVLRDVEFYTRQITTHVHEFLQYLSSMELVMRLQPSPHPELESKWVRFNVSMRDIEKVALEQHLSYVRKQVIEPFELVIKAYGNPSLAMKKRSKRRLDFEKAEQLKKGGKKVDKQLAELVEQYEALNESLKKELPKLSAMTEKVGNICLGNFVNIQTQWYSIWKEKVKVVLEGQNIPELADIISAFQRDFKFQDEQINTISIINPASKGRPSQSTSTDDSIRGLRPRASELSARDRGLSVNSDIAPSLPAPDFITRHSGQFTVSPGATSIPSPHQYYYKEYYASVGGQARPGSGSPSAADLSLGSRSMAVGSARPSTGQSYDSNGNGGPRQSSDSNANPRRYSNSIYSPGFPPENQRFSGLFHSALPLPDGPERSARPSRTSSRASSRERQPINGYNVLWLAASLFEFNIETTKHEAGYPYLTYQAGEIFDVIAEKGELWLAKNQDDPNNLVGWLWSKHFAKLADD